VRTRYLLMLAAALGTVSCAVGPHYERPAAPAPAAYKELPASSEASGVEWKPAQPSDALLRGKWWEVFGDSELDALEDQVAVANQNLAAAEAQFRGAQALAHQARAAYFPTVTAGAAVTRSSGVVKTTTPVAPGAAPATVNTYSASLDLAWELDLFGGIRRGVEAGVASAQASAADLESARLALQAELAADYFTLHGLDAQRQLLDTTVAGYQTALQLTENRYKQGVVSGVDVAQAQTQLETTRTQATDLGIARAQLEHAIAVLIGKPPAEFSLAPAPVRVVAPQIPMILPAELLERRPDIAAAERRVAAANAERGVATAGYFPTLALAGSGGYTNSTLAHLFTLPNRLWSLGPALAETVFDGGRRRAVREQAQAAWDAAVATYRETVLDAFEEVEDNLAALRILAEEATQQATAVAAADHSLALARNRYQGGITTYLEVVTAQTVALTNERAAVDLLTRRMIASVNLVKALGGGWRAADLPSRTAINARVASPAPTQTPTPDPSKGNATH
jgi:NodT family efflux transporter outer membrane factor (OMF) lipoprotein